MKEYGNIIIGFGKGGKTLAGALASKGEKTALIAVSYTHLTLPTNSRV